MGEDNWRIQRRYVIQRLNVRHLNWNPGPQSPPRPTSQLQDPSPETRSELSYITPWTRASKVDFSGHFCIKDLYSVIKQYLKNSELLLAPRQKVNPLSLAGSISGVFSVSAPDKVTPCWAEALFIPSLQPDNLWIRTSACNKSLCLWLYQWFSAGAMVLPQCLELFFMVKNGRWGMEGCHLPLMRIG